MEKNEFFENNEQSDFLDDFMASIGADGQTFSNGESQVQEEDLESLGGGVGKVFDGENVSAEDILEDFLSVGGEGGGASAQGASAVSGEDFSSYWAEGDAGEGFENLDEGVAEDVFTGVGAHGSESASEVLSVEDYWDSGVDEGGDEAGSLPFVSLELEEEDAFSGDGLALGEVEVEEEGKGFASTAVSTVMVSEDGKVGIEGEEKLRPWRDGGRVSDPEGEFFANLGVNAWEREKALESLRMPGGGLEAGEEADKRLRKVLQGLRGKDALKRGARVVFRERDMEVLDFLARFKYATASQLRYLHGVKESTMSNRLSKLKGQGLVESYTIFGPRPIWFLTKLGEELAGYGLPGLSTRGIAYGMLSHSFVVNHTAANLIGGNLNVLNLEDWPVYNRVKRRTGEVQRGDYVVSELEIQSSFGKLKKGRSELYKPKLMAIRDKAFRDWDAGGRVGPSPEFLPGNEWMWVILPGATANLAYHVPDLVVKRQRKESGAPSSIAVEIELNQKAKGYERVLKAFASEKILYDKLIWVCRSGGPARELGRVANELGLLESGYMDIVPIIGEEGVFKGRELWTL